MAFTDYLKEKNKGGYSSENSFSSYFKSTDQGKRMISQRIAEMQAEEEKKRRENTFNAMGVEQTRQLVAEQEKKATGIKGFFSGVAQTYKDLTRGKKDEDYLKQIEENTKNITEIIRRKKENPEKSEKYDLMLEALQEKNNILSQATGGALADKKTGQLVGQSLETAVDIMPFGSGITQAGRQILKQGGKILAGSLVKEGATFGLIGGTGKVLEEQQTAPKEILGTTLTEVIQSSIANLAFGLAGDAIGKKFSDWLNGKKTTFTPNEKEIIKTKTEVSDDIFEDAGVPSPIKETEEDIVAKTIAETNDEKVVKNLIKDTIPEQSIGKVSKILKNINNADDVARVLDEYNPEMQKKFLVEEIAFSDTEQAVRKALKDKASKETIDELAPILKSVRDENAIGKILDDYEINGLKTVEAPKPKAETMEAPTKKAEKITQEMNVGENMQKSETPKETPKVKEQKKISENPPKETLKKEESPKSFVEQTRSKLIQETKAKESASARKDALKLEMEAENLPEMGGMEMKRQIDKVEKLDEETLIKVGLALEDAPEGVKTGSAYVALKKKVKDNWKENRDLAKRLIYSDEIAEYKKSIGQEVKAFDDLERKNDPIEIARAIVETKKERAGKKNIEASNKEIREVVDNSFKVKQAQDLLNKLVC